MIAQYIWDKNKINPLFLSYKYLYVLSRIIFPQKNINKSFLSNLTVFKWLIESGCQRFNCKRRKKFRDERHCEY